MKSSVAYAAINDWRFRSMTWILSLMIVARADRGAGIVEGGYAGFYENL